MNKLIVIFVLLNVLNIYYQLDCWDFTDNTCGGFNSYKSKCHKFPSGCKEIQVDDGCAINPTNHSCTVENGATLGQNERCYDYEDNTKCIRIKHQCTSYIDNNCGGLKGTSSNKQCIKISGDNFCSEFDVDDYCQVNSKFECLKKTNDANFDKKYLCSFNKEKTSCKRQIKDCEERDSSSCEDENTTNDKCKKVVIGVAPSCKEVDIISPCTITDAGACSSLDATNRVCNFYEDSEGSTICQPRSKCTDIDAANQAACNAIKDFDGKKCSKVGSETNCKEVQIINPCIITDAGACGGTAPTHQVCEFNADSTICQPRSVCKDTDAENQAACNAIADFAGKKCSKVGSEAKCKEVQIIDPCTITDAGACGGTAPTHQVCEFNADSTICQPRSVCKDTDAENQAACNAIADFAGKKCSKVGSEAKCKEVKIDSQCEMDDNGECKLKHSSGSCDYIDAESICKFTPCSEYKNAVSCISAKGCLYYLEEGSEEGTCKEVTIGDNCKVENGACSDADTPEADATEKCLFNHEKTECRKRDKICSNYITNDCINEGLTATETKQCYKFDEWDYCKEIDVDANCNVISGICQKRTGANIADDKICGFVDDTKTSCRLLDRKCEQYTSNTCINLTYPNPNKKCFYYSSKCHEVELDNYCTVDERGDCVEKDDSALSDTEVCDYNTDKDECKKRKLRCNELSDDICDSYTPINNNFCFKYEGDSHCTEIIVEDDCQINSSNQCVAKRNKDVCTLDEKSDKCYKTKSGASLINIKLFSLLFLFFIC